MKLVLQALLVALLAIGMAAPGIGGEGEGGENAGGTGVWILPQSTHIACGITGGLPSSAAGQCFALESFSKNFELVTSSECGRVAAVVVDPASGTQIPLDVQGQTVYLGKDLLRQFLSAGVLVAEIMIVDEKQQGYRIDLRIDAAKSSGMLTLL